MAERVESDSLIAPTQKFSLIYANFSLHWSTSLDKVLSSLRAKLDSGGVLCFSVTDPDRSFWADVNANFKIAFKDCDLFRASPLKAMTKAEWIGSLKQAGFSEIKSVIFKGQASVASDSAAALAEFKKACGDRYLQLGTGINLDQAEAWLLRHLDLRKNSQGDIPISASGLGFICK